MKHKVLRLLTSVGPISKDRTGACNHCGACCHLPNKCVFIRYNDEGKSYCSIYKVRPPSCRKYPRTQSELLTPKECGYTFIESEEPDFSVHPGKKILSFRE